MSTWNFPEIIIPAFILAVAGSFWLMRAAGAVKRPPDFECKVCGRRTTSLYAKEWRYCPFCGARKGATSVSELPKRDRAE
jgi:hypothetical protein